MTYRLASPEQVQGGLITSNNQMKE